MEIVTERLFLRELIESDYEFFSTLETNELCLKYESDTIPLKEYIDNKFRNNLEDKYKTPRNRYRFMVVKLSSGELIGRIILWKIDDSINEWEIGWDVHPDYWGKGYAPEATREVLKFAFTELGVHRVQALCNDANSSSEKVMIKSGMKKEGTIRGVRKLNNSWYGSHIYALLESDFMNYN